MQTFYMILSEEMNVSEQKLIRVCFEIPVECSNRTPVRREALKELRLHVIHRLTFD